MKKAIAGCLSKLLCLSHSGDQQLFEVMVLSSFHRERFRNVGKVPYEGDCVSITSRDREVGFSKSFSSYDFITSSCIISYAE